MKMPMPHSETPTPPPPAPERGAPASYAAYAVRKNVAVRVSVTPPANEPEELREDGYGHGV